MYREGAKKFEKVDSFLKRFLSPIRYKGVRLIEPCVVVSSEYNKLFKFVVLADDWLYITENPPKLAKDIHGVTKIVNITSVELLNDVPEFLGGDLKYRAHHILLTYKRVSSTDVQIFNDASETSVLDPNEPKLNHGTYKDYNSNNTLSSTLIPETTHEEHSRYFTKRSSIKTSDIDEVCVGQDVQSSGSGRSKNCRLPLLTYSSFEDERRQRGTAAATALHHSWSSLDDLKTKDGTKSMRLTSSANAADLRAAKASILDENRLSTSGSEPNLVSSQRGLLSSFNGLQRRFRERRSSKSPGVEKKGFQFSGNVGKELEDNQEKPGSEIHFYMLLDDTVMLAYLRSTWDNCLLNAALKQNKNERSPKSLVKNEANSPSTAELFGQIRIEIIDSKEIKNTFVLVNELLTACKKNALVKKLFWQSPELFVFMVQQLKYYNEPSSNNGRKRNRADELEFIILVLECLTEMFRETELLAVRLSVLKTEKCRILSDLIQMTIFSSETKTSKLIDQSPEISEAAEVLLTGRSRKPKKGPKEINPQDVELESLSNELTKSQVALLHELFIIAYQAAWFPSDDDKFNICWMVKILETSKPVYRFIKCFVRQVMNFMEMAETGFLSTDNTTMLYRLFSVLKTLLQQSTSLHKHIQEYYTEEFRYYVKLHTLSKCLSKDCPLTSSTLKLVEDVRHLITNSSVGSRGVYPVNAMK